MPDGSDLIMIYLISGHPIRTRCSTTPVFHCYCAAGPSCCHPAPWKIAKMPKWFFLQQIKLISGPNWPAAADMKGNGKSELNLRCLSISGILTLVFWPGLLILCFEVAFSYPNDLKNQMWPQTYLWPKKGPLLFWLFGLHSFIVGRKIDKGKTSRELCNSTWCYLSIGLSDCWQSGDQ